MRIRILKTILGLTMTSQGAILAILTFSDFSRWDILSVVVSVLLIGAGVYLLFKEGRVEKRITFEDVLPGSRPKSLIEKNNEMLVSYHKTAALRDKLKVLKHNS